MSIISRLCSVFEDKAPIHPSHTYEDVVTGERFVVESVGPAVEITRLDAERRPQNSVRKREMRKAISEEIVIHERSRCKECNDV